MSVGVGEVGLAVEGAEALLVTQDVACEEVMELVGVDVEEVEFWGGVDVGDEEFDFVDVLGAGEVIAFGERIVTLGGVNVEVAIAGVDRKGRVEGGFGRVF